MAEFEVQQFVSSKTINKEREAIREARERILRDAERKAEMKVSRDEEAKSRGDDKWMLPDLDEKLKKKKKKKKKKRKKEGKSSDSEDDWVESGNNKPVSACAPQAESKPAPGESKRDDWMEMGMISTYSRGDNLSKREKREKEKKEQEEANAPGSSSRELNPYFAKGGSGMPSENKVAGAVRGGDGGVAWLLKAFKRAEEQAKEENVPLEEIAAKRWGSLQKFNEMLSKAKQKAGIQCDIKPDETNRSKNRNRSKSREKRKHRSRSREKRKSKSRSREKRKSKSRSREKRKSRSRSREKRKSRSRSIDRKRQRSRSKDGKRGETRQKRSRSRSPLKFAKPGERVNSSSYNRNASSGGWKTSSRREEERNKYKEEQEAKRKEEKKNSSGSSSDSELEPAPAQPEPSEEKPKILTETELNVLAAKIVKAEILGNEDIVTELKARLSSAREARSAYIAGGGDPEDQGGPEVITKIQFHDTKGSRKKTKVETHKDGQRIRYFGDDDRYDLKQMYEREKMNTAEDQNSMLSSLAGRACEKTTDEYDMDDMMVTKAARKKNEEAEEAKKLNREAASLIELDKTLEDCKWCMGSRRSNKHLMVSMGKSVYMSVPGHTSMGEGHCLIVPMGHVTAGTHLDEDVWQEVQDYRKALVRMFSSRDEDCVLMETAVGFKKHPHMVLECIPLPADMGSMAPMYFQKAIQECESEWSDNRKLIKLKDRKISRNVPKGLPYFHVDFGNDNGFAHVIEDEENFSRRFGHEIVGGMLDIEARTFRNPAWEGFEAQKKKVLEFSTMWKEFDWTARLKEARSSDSSDSD